MPTAKPFRKLLTDRESAVDSLLCVGLDPVMEKLPAPFPRTIAGVGDYLVALIEATNDLVSSYKPNLPFYLAFGDEGTKVLRRVREAVPADIPMVLDCKVNDMGDTARAWAKTVFNYIGADAVVVNPYMGEDALTPYFAYGDKGVIALVKTSNPGSGDVQDLPLENGTPLYMHIAAKTNAWNQRHPADIGMVVGANHADKLSAIRALCPSSFILLPGLGAQGGDVQASVSAGVDANGGALLCSSSRSIMYASSGTDFAEAARAEAQRLRDEINLYRHQVVNA
ncbi:MAG: orotidine-5'-phosphate decarboxylase [Thermomicrobiales bacterium]|nr:orotidine-5'-phosphate decarboxylase [Thermomicrobiales bacterium]MCO5226996.1 orotidine-5'-phosphate decarboxylase [Thermomicrobiales bacterium]